MKTNLFTIACLALLALPACSADEALDSGQAGGGSLRNRKQSELNTDIYAGKNLFYNTDSERLNEHILIIGMRPETIPGFTIKAEGYDDLYVRSELSIPISPFSLDKRYYPDPYADELRPSPDSDKYFTVAADGFSFSLVVDEYDQFNGFDTAFNSVKIFRCSNLGMTEVEDGCVSVSRADDGSFLVNVAENRYSTTVSYALFFFKETDGWSAGKPGYPCIMLANKVGCTDLGVFLFEQDGNINATSPAPATTYGQQELNTIAYMGLATGKWLYLSPDEVPCNSEYLDYPAFTLKLSAEGCPDIYTSSRAESGYRFQLAATGGSVKVEVTDMPADDSLIIESIFFTIDEQLEVKGNHCDSETFGRLEMTAPNAFVYTAPANRSNAGRQIWIKMRTKNIYPESAEGIYHNTGSEVRLTLGQMPGI